jgi:hypothetical protein
VSGLGWEKRYKPTTRDRDWGDRILLTIFGGITLASLVALALKALT